MDGRILALLPLVKNSESRTRLCEDEGDNDGSTSFYNMSREFDRLIYRNTTSPPLLLLLRAKSLRSKAMIGQGS